MRWSWGTVLLSAFFLMISVGTLVAVLTQEPVRVGPASSPEVIFTAGLMVFVAMMISYALIAGEAEE